MGRESSPDAVSSDQEAENSCPHGGLMGGMSGKSKRDKSLSTYGTTVQGMLWIMEYSKMRNERGAGKGWSF